MYIKRTHISISTLYKLNIIITDVTNKDKQLIELSSDIEIVRNLAKTYTNVYR